MKRIPVFEAFVSLLSCYLAVILLWNDDFFSSNPTSYDKLSNLVDEKTAAAIFFIAATVKICGILLNLKSLRIIGLAMSALIYLSIATTYFLGNALWGLGIFSLLSVFSVISIFEVKYTKL